MRKSLLLLLVVAACAHQPSAVSHSPAPKQEPLPIAPDSLNWRGDEDLAPVLVQKELTPYVMAGADRVEMRLGNSEFADRLADVAEDSAAPWLVRVNALKLLATRGALEQLPVFNEAMHAKDEVVRIAAVNDMREYMALRPEAATPFLVAALKDPSTRVQTAALQILGDRDMEALREFANTTPNPEMKTIAIDIIQAGEERGAALVAKDSSGVLQRTTQNGTVLTFKPTERWTNWDAAVGDVTVALPGKKPVLIASGIEEVGNVVPAFFSTDGNTLVYEVNREIHTRDLQTGTDKKIADGIAPRVLGSNVIYMNEIKAKRIETPNNVGLKYDVMSMPVAGGTATSIGQIGSQALNNLKGNYATIRWARIREDEGNFFLVGDQIDPFKLPSPFGS